MIETTLNVPPKSSSSPHSAKDSTLLVSELEQWVEKDRVGRKIERHSHSQRGRVRQRTGPEEGWGETGRQAYRMGAIVGF